MLKRLNMLMILIVFIAIPQVACTKPSYVSTDTNNIKASEKPKLTITPVAKDISNAAPETTVTPLPDNIDTRSCQGDGSFDNVVKRTVPLTLTLTTNPPDNFEITQCSNPGSKQ